MRDSTLNAITPVGWPPLKEILPKVLANKIQIYACGACCKARGIVVADLDNKNAKFGNPQIFVGQNGVIKLLPNNPTPFSRS
jgi:sulfur relay (sulfurtransferase) complex TusBCD TusD component (DsrE family)